MLLILVSMLSVVYSKFQWNDSVQFAALPFRNAGFKVQVCMAKGGGGKPSLTCCMCCSCVRCQSLSFRSRVVVVVVVVVSWSCRGLVLSGVDDSKTTRSVSLNVSVNSR